MPQYINSIQEASMAGGWDLITDVLNGAKHAFNLIRPLINFKGIADYLKASSKNVKENLGLPTEEEIQWAESPLYDDSSSKENPLYQSKKDDEVKNKESDSKKQEMSVLSRILDFVLSPSFLRILTIVAAGTLAFSPLGPVFVGVAAAMCAIGIIYEVAMSVHNYRTVKNRQEERAILEGIKSIDEEKKILLKGLEKNCKGIGNLQATPNVTPKEFTVNVPKIFAKTFANIGSGVVTTAIANAISLNPVGLGISIASSVLSFTGNAGSEAIYRKRVNELNAINEKLANEVLGEHTNKGRDNTRLLGTLNERKTELEALKLMKEVLGDKVVSLEEFRRVKAICVEQIVTEKIGFARGEKGIFAEVAEVIVKGFSRQKMGQAMSATREEYNQEYKNRIANVNVENAQQVKQMIGREFEKSTGRGDLPHEHVKDEMKRRSQRASKGAEMGA